MHVFEVSDLIQLIASFCKHEICNLLMVNRLTFALRFDIPHQSCEFCTSTRECMQQEVRHMNKSKLIVGLTGMGYHHRGTYLTNKLSVQCGNIHAHYTPQHIHSMLSHFSYLTHLTIKISNYNRIPIHLPDTIRHLKLYGINAIRLPDDLISYEYCDESQIFLLNQYLPCLIRLNVFAHIIRAIHFDKLPNLRDLALDADTDFCIPIPLHLERLKTHTLKLKFYPPSLTHLSTWVDNNTCALPVNLQRLSMIDGGVIDYELPASLRVLKCNSITAINCDLSHIHTLKWISSGLKSPIIQCMPCLKRLYVYTIHQVHNLARLNIEYLYVRKYKANDHEYALPNSLHTLEIMEYYAPMESVSMLDIENIIIHSRFK